MAASSFQAPTSETSVPLSLFQRARIDAALPLLREDFPSCRFDLRPPNAGDTVPSLASLLTSHASYLARPNKRGGAAIAGDGSGSRQDDDCSGAPHAIAIRGATEASAQCAVRAVYAHLRPQPLASLTLVAVENEGGECLDGLKADVLARGVQNWFSCSVSLVVVKPPRGPKGLEASIFIEILRAIDAATNGDTDSSSTATVANPLWIVVACRETEARQIASVLLPCEPRIRLVLVTAPSSNLSSPQARLTHELTGDWFHQVVTTDELRFVATSPPPARIARNNASAVHQKSTRREEMAASQQKNVLLVDLAYLVKAFKTREATSVAEGGAAASVRLANNVADWLEADMRVRFNEKFVASSSNEVRSPLGESWTVLTGGVETSGARRSIRGLAPIKQKNVDALIILHLWRTAARMGAGRSGAATAPRVVLVAGDGDFAPVVEMLRTEFNCRVTVVASSASCSTALKTAAQSEPLWIPDRVFAVRD